MKNDSLFYHLVLNLGATAVIGVVFSAVISAVLSVSGVEGAVWLGLKSGMVCAVVVGIIGGWHKQEVVDENS